MPDRARLTLDDALRGVQPEPYTRAEWQAMHAASGEETRAKIERIAWEVVREIARTRRERGG